MLEIVDEGTVGSVQANTARARNADWDRFMTILHAIGLSYGLRETWKGNAQPP